MSTKCDKRFFRPFGIRLNDSNHKATGQRVYDHLKYIFSSSYLHVQSMKKSFAIQSLMEYNPKTIPWQEMSTIKVGDADIAPVSSARNLGTCFDSHMEMSVHISKTCSSAFYYLYNIRHIRKYLSKEHTEQLIHAFVTSRLDYCSGLLYGVPECQIKKLQRVMNASARLIYCVPKFCHITPILKELHWLPVRARIEFKILFITFKAIKGLAPKYLSDLREILQMSSYNLRRNNNVILLARSTIRTKKTIGDRAFMIAAPILWNSLPLSVRQAATVDNFKSMVKTHLFAKAYN